MILRKVIRLVLLCAFFALTFGILGAIAWIVLVLAIVVLHINDPEFGFALIVTIPLGMVTGIAFGIWKTFTTPDDRPLFQKTPAEQR